MKIFILTEGGRKYGLGHMARCCALYDAFKEKGETPRIIVNGDSAIQPFLNGKRHSVINWLEEQEKLLKIVKKADIVVIDSYLAGKDLYKKISSLAGVPVYIDDTDRLSYPPGVIVNGAAHIEKSYYLNKEANDHLLGGFYTLLQKPFWDVPKKIVKKQAKEILVTFGGADLINLTIKVLELLVLEYPEFSKKIVIGRNFAGIKGVERSKDDTTELIFHPSGDKMKRLMLKADMAISAGGQTLYELARVGLPTIAVATAANQLSNIKGCRKAGCIKYAGFHDEKELLAKLSRSLDAMLDYGLRNKMSLAGRKLITGEGAKNVVDRILTGQAVKKNRENGIALRKAGTGDCYDVWKWRNHPDVRKASFGKEKIIYGNHKKWFRKIIKDPDVKFYIAQDKELNKVGQVRFDLRDHGTAAINVNLNPVFFGKGLGSICIKKATDILIKDRPGINEVFAEIIDNNEPSKKAFCAAGYSFFKKTSKEDRRISIYKYRNR